MILLGLTGSVATVLYDKLIKELSELDEVEVILTERAKAFINKQDILSYGAKRVYTDIDEWTWGNKPYWNKDDPVLHIQLRERATSFVIAPCSLNTMAKLANGICDNLLTSVARAWDFNRPMMIAPAANTYMWEHPITNVHLQTLKNFNYSIIMPQRKMLACGTEGMGALADISEIVKTTEKKMFSPVMFPLGFCTGIPVNPHPGAFGYKRRESIHTGVDLYTEDGALVSAMEKGTVVSIEHFTGAWDGSPWWNETDCILIEGVSGVICYGEVKPRWDIKVGDKIFAGQYIANVKRVIKDGRERPDITGHRPSMLHVELYKNGTKKASNGFTDELRDPTKLLLNSLNRPVAELVYADYKPGVK